MEKTFVPKESIVVRLIKRILMCVIAEIIVEEEGCSFQDALREVERIAREVES